MRPSPAQGLQLRPPAASPHPPPHMSSYVPAAVRMPSIWRTPTPTSIPGPLHHPAVPGPSAIPRHPLRVTALRCGRPAPLRCTLHTAQPLAEQLDYFSPLQISLHLLLLRPSHPEKHWCSNPGEQSSATRAPQTRPARSPTLDRCLQPLPPSIQAPAPRPPQGHGPSTLPAAQVTPLWALSASGPAPHLFQALTSFQSISRPQDASPGERTGRVCSPQHLSSPGPELMAGKHVWLRPLWLLQTLLQLQTATPKERHVGTERATLSKQHHKQRFGMWHGTGTVPETPARSLAAQAGSQLTPHDDEASTGFPGAPVLQGSPS